MKKAPVKAGALEQIRSYSVKGQAAQTSFQFGLTLHSAWRAYSLIRSSSVP